VAKKQPLIGVRPQFQGLTLMSSGVRPLFRMTS
jgi:hypothetical protein